MSVAVLATACALIGCGGSASTKANSADRRPVQVERFELSADGNLEAHAATAEAVRA